MGNSEEAAACQTVDSRSRSGQATKFQKSKSRKCKKPCCRSQIDRNSNRDALLEMPLPQGEYTTLRESKKMEDSAPCDDNNVVVVVVVAVELFNNL